MRINLTNIRGGMNMQIETRYANHPEDIKRYNTDELRDNFLVEKLFDAGKVHLTYTHVDRMIFGE